MTPPATPHRLMLVHFDPYSTALHFAQWDGSLLWPAPLPPEATPAPPGEPDADQAAALATAMAGLLGLEGALLQAPEGFGPRFQSAAGDVQQVHLLRLDTFEPPREALAAAGGVFKPISALRGGAPAELGLAREVFNLIVSGGGRA